MSENYCSAYYRQGNAVKTSARLISVISNIMLTEKEKKKNATLDTKEVYIEIEKLVCLREGLTGIIPCRCFGLEERFHAHLTVAEICYAFSNIRMHDSSSNHSRRRVLLQLVSTTLSNDWPALINSSADPLA